MYNDDALIFEETILILRTEGTLQYVSNANIIYCVNLYGKVKTYRCRLKNS